MNTPRLITKRQVILDVPKRWREQYPNLPKDDWKSQRAEALKALDWRRLPTPTLRESSATAVGRA